MPLRIGIVGLPNVGKSTLFNALTRSKGAQSANYPFCTIEPNVGIVEVPDIRLDKLAEIVKPARVVPAAIEFVDIAGLVKGSHKGEGLGNRFLAAISEVDAICHVIRYFDDADIMHVEGAADPVRDKGIIETELIMSDLEYAARAEERMAGAARSGDKERQKDTALLTRIKETLNTGKPAYATEMTDEERKSQHIARLLTMKPVIYACNFSENQLRAMKQEGKEIPLYGDSNAIAVSAKIEDDLQCLSENDARDFLLDLDIKDSGLDRLIRAAYEALGYITFFTAGPKEVRAWNIPEGYTAPRAAGVIHTDFEKGFIRAEVISYVDFVKSGGEQKARESGKSRQEGKEYVVRDGDIMHFRFNV